MFHFNTARYQNLITSLYHYCEKCLSIAHLRQLNQIWYFMVVEDNIATQLFNCYINSN